MATGQRVDPFLSYNFLVELDGIARAAFSEVERARRHHRSDRVPGGRVRTPRSASSPA